MKTPIYEPLFELINIDYAAATRALLFSRVYPCWKVQVVIINSFTSHVRSSFISHTTPVQFPLSSVPCIFYKYLRGRKAVASLREASGSTVGEVFGHIRVLIRSVLGGGCADRVQVDAGWRGSGGARGRGARGCRCTWAAAGARRPHVPGRAQSLARSRGRLSTARPTARRQRQVAPTPAACALRSPRPARSLATVHSAGFNIKLKY